MQKYKKKLAVNITVCLILFASICLFAACGNDSDENLKSGKDEYGREYGKIYGIDEYATGEYRLPYSIEDTSAVGKSMIEQYCVNYMLLKVGGGTYSLTFYCKSNALNSVKLGQEGNLSEGQSVQEDDKYGYVFEIDRQMLNDKMSMACTVKLMNREVNFSVRADLDKAVLVG